MAMDAVVIGAGHAGLAVSRRLADHGIDHVVLERGEIGETWRAQRWDSFRLNTPNFMARLPGSPEAARPDGFLGRDDWIAELEAYARMGALPVRTDANVTAGPPDGNHGFVITANRNHNRQPPNVGAPACTPNTPKAP